MNLNAVPIGKNAPHDVNVVIEVPIGGEPIKYEMDKESGALVVDRFLYTSMRYPGNYGFIPHTLSDDGDPCDVIVANTRAIVPGAIMSCKIVGVLLMEDEHGGDEKLLAVPSAKLTKRYAKIENYSDLPEITLQPDRALLRPLQGSRAQQVGQDHSLGRRRRGAQARHGRGRTRQGGEGLTTAGRRAADSVKTAHSARCMRHPAALRGHLPRKRRRVTPPAPLAARSG